jgi:hypothetical protein
MTSLTAKDAGLLTPVEKRRPLLADKNGFPLNKQVPKTQQAYAGVGGETITLDGSDALFVTVGLTGVLTINATDASNLRGRIINVYVRGGVGQNVVINFPAAGYPMYIGGAAGAATAYTIAANANNQKATIHFGTTFAYIES